MGNVLHLHSAVAAGDLGEVKKLLSQGYDIGEVNPKTGINSLHLAVLTGNYDIVELLSRDEAHINSTCSLLGGDCEGFTPLHFSVEVCHKNITQLLLSRKANVNNQNKDGDTPLHVAASFGTISNHAKCLLLNGGEAYSENDNCLHIVRGIKIRSTMNAYSDITDILLASGANAQLVNEAHETALHLACLHGNDTVAQIIVKKCSSIVNYKNFTYMTALHIVANSYYSNWETVKLLIDYGADIDAADLYSYTPLCNACMKNNLDVVRILVESGCDVNIGIDDMPINIAISFSEVEIFKLLLKHGADISKVDLFTDFDFLSSEKIDHEIFLLKICCKDFFKTTVDVSFYYEYFRIYSYFEIFKLLLQHGYFKIFDRNNLYFDGTDSLMKYVIKVKTLGCFFAMDYPDISVSNIILLPNEEEYGEDCKMEVEILRGKFVYSDISLLDFLQKDLNLMVRLLKNREIVNLLKYSNYEIFPIYGDLIKVFFKFGMQRRSLLNRCYECFNVIFFQYPELPDMIVEYIFDFFTTEDLRILLTTWDPHH